MNKYVRCIDITPFVPENKHPQLGEVYKAFAEDAMYLYLEMYWGGWSKRCFVNVAGCPCNVKACIAKHR